MRPWKRLASRNIVSDKWISLRADRCELPDGSIVDPYYVLEEKEWIAVFAIDQRDRILLVRQYRYAGNATCLELPGGGIEQGEEPLQAAQRELREETGFVASDWTFSGALFANPARQTNRLHVFVARNLHRAGTQQLDDAEDIVISFIEMPAVKAMIKHGEFSQALHVAAFYLGCEAAFGNVA